MKKLGWIGLGNMGAPMARNLEKAGFPLSVYNRNTEKTILFRNGKATVCKSVPELVTASDIVFTMVSNDQAVQAIYDEIITLENISGKLFIDMSTVSQKLSVSVANRLKEKGASFLDAPVAGSTQPAANGTLIIMVGGDAADVETARPYFEKLGKLTKHLGPNGNGIATKLSVNYFVSLIYLGLAETMLFAGKQGVSRADLLEIINESAVGSGATKIKTPLLIKGEYPPAFALDLMLKDILLAKDNGADFPLTKALTETYQQAQKAGYGEHDVMAVIKFLEKLNQS
jgi:3-hydroxyisobutyrate dehydrogenase